MVKGKELKLKLKTRLETENKNVQIIPRHHLNFICSHRNINNLPLVFHFLSLIKQRYRCYNRNSGLQLR